MMDGGVTNEMAIAVSRLRIRPAGELTRESSAGGAGPAGTLHARIARRVLIAQGRNGGGR